MRLPRLGSRGGDHRGGSQRQRRPGDVLTDAGRTGAAAGIGDNRRVTQQPARTVVVKVGSRALTAADGGPLSSRAVDAIVEQLAGLSAAGVGGLLVTSGAIATGRGAVGSAARGRAIDVLQSLAAVGQGMLMAEYARPFRERGTMVAQV